MGHQPNSGASGDVNEAGPPRYFYFNRLVQESGNVPRDKAMLKIEFEKALDEFFDRRPHTITVANEVERL